MGKEKKMYAWMPSNCERFCETYDSIEQAVAEAQKQWDEKYEFYEEEGDNNTEIYLMVARQFNPEDCLNRYGENLIDYLEDQLYDFTHGVDSDPGVFCRDLVSFNQMVKESLIPLVKKSLIFQGDMVGDILSLTYNVTTRKYHWNGEEYDDAPDAFKQVGGMESNAVGKYKILFADLDGTLIETMSGEIFPKGIWDMKLKFDVLDKIKEMNPEFLLIVTNQGGIEKGFVDENEFQLKSEYVSRAIREYCGCRVHSMYCTSNDKGNKFRKPNVGMLEVLCADYIGDDFRCIRSKSLMIGDASGKPGQFSDSDRKCAENFGIDYLDVEDFLQTVFEEGTI